MNYFIADTHFGHRRSIGMGRPFQSIEEMDSVIIENWNRVVCPDDMAYVLGDFWYRGTVPALQYLHRLRGRKVLVTGNHDWFWMLNDPEAVACFERVEKLLFLREEKVFLCHYPMLEWNGDKRGVYLIHGHTHAGDYLNRTGRLYRILQLIPMALNACVEINGYTPVTLEQLIENNNRFYQRKAV